MPRFSSLLFLFTLAACGKSDTDTTETATDSGRSETGETAQAAIDADSDGFSVDEDCDDTNPDIHPDAVEVCNEVDDNCDGLVDDADPAVDPASQSNWYGDQDNDGYGSESDLLLACVAPSGYLEESAMGFDCDDSDPAFHPGAVEWDCTDPNDYNCDGSVGFADEDNDGFAACEDCDDSAGEVHPSAIEICDGLDNDCNAWIDDSDPGLTGAPTWYGDADGDTYGGTQFTATACEVPQGYVDNADDCNDLDAATYPGATEICDEADNNCDGDIDEGVQTTWYADTDNDGYGDSTSTKEACTVPAGYVWDATDCDDSSATTNPASYEVCDGVDNNCDGVTDEDSALDVETWYADTDGDGYGSASTTAIACDQPTGYVTDNTDCDDTAATTYPGADEYCDNVDTDCDGTVDESAALDADTWYADDDGDGYGDASNSGKACDQPTGYVADNTDCDDSTGTTYPGAAETCDDVDADCDSSFVDTGDDDCHAQATCTPDSGGTNHSCECNNGYIGDGTSTCDVELFPASTLLSTANQTQLNTWASSPGQAWTLCYRKSTHGASATTFHSQCDSYSKTFSVAQLSTGVLIGGYAATSWSGSGYQANSSNFLFSLTRGYQIMSGSGVSGFQVYSQYNNNNYGPTFGGGHDWNIKSNMNSGYCNLGYTYGCQVGSAGSTTCRNDFCGNYNSWSITDMEVWGR